jgi:hypothetical protein
VLALGYQARADARSQQRVVRVFLQQKHIFCLIEVLVLGLASTLLLLLLWSATKGGNVWIIEVLGRLFPYSADGGLNIANIEFFWSPAKARLSSMNDQGRQV